MTDLTLRLPATLHQQLAQLSFGRQDKIAQQLDAFPMRVRSQANSQWGELSANNLGNLVEYNIIYLYGIGLKL